MKPKAALQAIEDATYTPLEAPCGARVAEMESTFFGKPSGELVSFECENKQGGLFALGHRQGQQSIFELGLHLVGADRVGQREASSKAAVGALNAVVSRCSLTSFSNLRSPLR